MNETRKVAIITGAERGIAFDPRGRVLGTLPAERGQVALSDN
jgi:hypothetical protein